MRYKCRAESFYDVCKFFIWLKDYNKINDNNRVFVYNINIYHTDYTYVIFEFDSNINDYLHLRKIIYDVDNNFHIMVRTLKQIEYYTGDTDSDFYI